MLFRTTEVCKELFIVEHGAISLIEDAEDDGDTPGAVSILGPGESAGEVAFVFGLRHYMSAKCEAEGPANLFTLSSDNFKLLIKMFPEQEDLLMHNTMMQYDGARAHARTRHCVRGTAQRASAGGTPMLTHDASDRLC
jgi:CRP-like cAMP-binding protein